MNIRDWGLGQIMQLPDCCFGRRFIVSCDIKVSGEAEVWDISEIGFPDVCVLWTVGIFWYYHKSLADYIRLALGDHLPGSPAEMDALEPLIPGFGAQGPEPRRISCYLNAGQEVMHMRQAISAQGRRLVVEAISSETFAVHVRVYVEVSSIPTEVPDCLLSGYLRSQS